MPSQNIWSTCSFSLEKDMTPGYNIVEYIYAHLRWLLHQTYFLKHGEDITNIHSHDHFETSEAS